MKKKFDLLLLVVSVLLTLFGLLMIYNVSPVVAARDFGDKYFFIRNQILWTVLGMLILFIFSKVNYQVWRNLALPLLIITILLLIAVFIPGVGIKTLGAARWIDLKFFVLQPTEFSKLSLSIYLAAWLAKPEKGRLWAFLLLLALVLGLVLAQPDMGTGVVLASTALLLYFLSGANIMHFLFILPIMIIMALVFIKIAPYRVSRILTFLDPLRDPQGASYHIQQILLALGSGGLFGVGIGQSLQKFEYLPEVVTDSIFAIIAEEFGFIGGLFIITLFIILVFRGFNIAQNAKDIFGKLLALGLTSFLAVQTIINLASQVSLLPLTGVPLPFISYGGSSLIVNLASIGILLNISKTKN